MTKGRTWAAALTIGAALAMSGCTDSQETQPTKPISQHTQETDTALMQPRQDVLTAIGLSDSWHKRSAEWQEAACARFVAEPQAVLAILQSNAAVLAQAFHAPTAVEFIEGECFRLDSAPAGEIGTAVSLEPASGISAVQRPRKARR